MTYGRCAKRAQHARQMAGIAAIDRETTVTESRWKLVAAGLSPELQEIAAGIAEGTVMRKGPRPAWIPDDSV